MFISEKSADCQSLLYSAQHNHNTRQALKTSAYASIMTTINPLLQEGESLPLSISLQARHSFEATDPRDKLFALMEMSNPTSWGPVQIDYAKDILPLQRNCPLHIY